MLSTAKRGFCYKTPLHYSLLDLAKGASVSKVSSNQQQDNINVF
jgi:hypothetical protein